MLIIFVHSVPATYKFPPIETSDTNVDLPVVNNVDPRVTAPATFNVEFIETSVMMGPVNAREDNLANPPTSKVEFKETSDTNVEFPVVNNVDSVERPPTVKLLFIKTSELMLTKFVFTLTAVLNESVVETGFTNKLLDLMLASIVRSVSIVVYITFLPLPDRVIAFDEVFVVNVD